MAVFESTANVHSVSLAFSLPATTTLSGDADFTVPWAFLAFIFISAGFGFASAGFCVGAGVVAGAGAGAGAGVGVCATAIPTAPIPNTSAISSATDLFTLVTPPLQVRVGSFLLPLGRLLRGIYSAAKCVGNLADIQVFKLVHSRHHPPLTDGQHT